MGKRGRPRKLKVEGFEIAPNGLDSGVVLTTPIIPEDWIIKDTAVVSGADISIDNELVRYERSIKRIQDTIDTIDPMRSEDEFIRLKLAEGMADLMAKLPKLLSALKDLRSEFKKDSIRGEQELSPLAKGELDD